MNKSILGIYFLFFPMYKVVWPSLHMKFIQFLVQFNYHIVIRLYQFPDLHNR